MLRLLVLLLVLANTAYFAWTREGLAPWGLAPAPQSEPGRLAQQVGADRLRLITPEEARRRETTTSAARAPECLQAGLFDDAQAAALRKALATLPAGTWMLEPGAEAARWLVYMGRFPVPEALAKKQQELKSLNIRFATVTHPKLSPGLSLGEFPNEAAAEQALANLTERGVRTARLELDRPAARGQWLRLPRADAALRQRVEELAALPSGKALRPCN
jgi:hypothetical protein